MSAAHRATVGAGPSAKNDVCELRSPATAAIGHGSNAARIDAGATIEGSPRVDDIAVSPQGRAFLAYNQRPLPFVLDNASDLTLHVAIGGGRAIALENGIYRLV